MYSIFEKLFSSANDLGVSEFTSYFLLFQFLLFAGLLSLQGIRIYKEIFIMKKVQSELISIHKTSNTEAYEIDRQINNLFSKIKKSRYKMLWERYYNRVSEKKEDERINVEPFFGFDIMHYHMGYRSLMDVGAGISVSIGVLGTFIGLSMGLSDLQIGSTEALRTGIGGLLNGMKVAFYTSVWGVTLSLFWTLIDRLISGQLDRNIDWHSEKMDYLLSTDDEELFLNRLEKITRDQSAHLKTLLTDALERVMQPVVMTIRESNGNVSQAFTQLHDQFSKLQSGVENQSKLLENQLELTKTNSHDISDRLVEQITGGTQESISDYSALIKDSQILQTQMVQTINQVVDSFASTQNSQSTTIERTERLFETFEQMTAEMNQMRSSYAEASNFMGDLSKTFQNIQQLTQDQLPVQHEVMRSNQSLADKYDGLTERFIEFNENVERKYEGLLEEVLTISKGLTSTFQQMTNKFSDSLTIQTNMLKESDTLLQNVKGVVQYLTPIAPELKDVVGNINHLKEQLTTMQQLQNDLLPELVEMKQQTNEVVEDALSTTKSYMSDMRDQLDAMKSNWNTTRDQFEITRETLQISVRDFSENIDNGLSKTYQHFDETLTNAVKQVSQLVYQFSDLQKDFVDTLEDLTEEMSKTKAVNVK
ncbi:MotA/TolQ/ExbB proton channel family protein [Neobacillus sp. MER 74]|uniref:MotA/TolQ/ExbB proton channel family protein n=1 Tax=Neobacillus sp. MER 74 TaxID=2939566 RepID=UPI00204257D0|nr:MotA/TolQ/ExbB proton channel family protein [Neobacillus sp. MER 74]MCM3118798.1 MotA/TolQ/ExbB proton channel family protein [Neobacillus sp. MER 74]